MDQNRACSLVFVSDVRKTRDLSANNPLERIGSGQNSARIPVQVGLVN